MIKLNELRIGNYVLDEDGKIQKVFSIIQNFPMFGNIVCHEENPLQLHSNISTLRPIPITEEWLIRFGFKNHNNWLALELGKGVGNKVIRIKTHRFPLKSNIIRFRAGYFILGDIQYIHQLQNLHYSLTGKELELND